MAGAGIGRDCVVAAQRRRPSRLFAPAFILRWAVGAALLAAVAIWFVGRPSDEGRRRRAYGVAPLMALWLWTVPFLPFVPDRLPLLLMLAGPLRWIIGAAAVGFV